MGRKRRMIDTHEEDGEGLPSRTALRAKRKDAQARLETLAKRLAKLSVQDAARLELGEELTREVAQLGTMRPGSAMARQRRRVAGLLRTEDLDALEVSIERRLQNR